MSNIMQLNDENFESAISGDKPSIVDFWAGFCSPCKVLSPILEEISDEFEDKINIIKVSMDDPKTVGIYKKYEVKALPTIIFIKNGEVVQKIVGLTTKKVIVELVEGIID